MAKAVKKKSAKETSNIFHNIMEASVAGNPKPKMDLAKAMQALKHIQEEIAMVVPDRGKYLVMQVNPTTGIFYNISARCPKDVSQKIEKIILEQTTLIGIPVTTDDIE